MRRLLGREAGDGAAPRRFFRPVRSTIHRRFIADCFCGAGLPGSVGLPSFRKEERRAGRRRDRGAWGSLAPRAYDRLVARVLLATDGSAEAELATLVAVEQAKATGSELHVVHVGRLPNFLMQDPDVVGHECKLYDELERESRERLRRLAWQVKVAGGTVAGAHLRMGWPGREITRLGEEIGAGVIVVGSRGHSRLRRAIAGSVSDSVVRHARCPVLVVSPEPRADRRWAVLRTPGRPSSTAIR